MNLDEFFDKFDLPPGWSVYRILPNGREELVASGVSIQRAEELAREILNQKRPGVTVNLREAQRNF